MIVERGPSPVIRNKEIRFKGLVGVSVGLAWGQD